MPTLLPDVALSAPDGWVTPGDRQEAARQAYRRSVAVGQPLTGVELGARFHRSARWGPSRIAEVRSEDISRSHSHSANAAVSAADHDPSSAARTIATDAGLPIGSDGSANHQPRRTGDNGNSAHADPGSTALPIRRNGNGHMACRSAGHEPLDASPPASETEAGHPAGTPAVRRITTVAVLAVALVAGVASYDHQRVLAQLAGEGWRAYLLPLSVDGLIVAASMSMLVRRRAGQPAGALAWCALLLGIAASLAANVVAADPELVDAVLVSRVVAAWPPIALGLSFELSIGQLRPANPRSLRT